MSISVPQKSINILGISAYYHDSAAALVEDGRVLAAAQEERFTRRKHDSRFPHHAVRACLESARTNARVQRSPTGVIACGEISRTFRSYRDEPTNCRLFSRNVFP